MKSLIKEETVFILASFKGTFLGIVFTYFSNSFVDFSYSSMVKLKLFCMFYEILYFLVGNKGLLFLFLIIIARLKCSQSEPHLSLCSYKIWKSSSRS